MNTMRFVAGLLLVALVVSGQQSKAVPQPQVPANVRTLVDQARVLPVEYAVDLLLPSIGRGLLKPYPRLEREVLIDLYQRASAARARMTRWPSYDAMGTDDIYAAAIGVGAQRLDRLSIQNRVLKILASRDARLARATGGVSGAAIPVSRAGCGASFVDFPVWFYEDLEQAVDFEAAASTQPSSVGYLADFLLFATRHKGLSVQQRERLSLTLASGLRAAPADLSALLTANAVLQFQANLNTWVMSLDELPSSRLAVFMAYRTFLQQQLSGPRCRRGEAFDSGVKSMTDAFAELAGQHPEVKPLRGDEVEAKESVVARPVATLNEKSYQVISVRFANWETAVQRGASQSEWRAAWEPLRDATVAFLKAKRPFALSGEGAPEDEAELNALQDWRVNGTIVFVLQRLIETGSPYDEVLDALLPRLVSPQRDEYPALYVLLYRQLANLGRLRGTKFSAAGEAIDRAVATAGDPVLSAYFAADRALGEPYDAKWMSSGAWMQPQF